MSIERKHVLAMVGVGVLVAASATFAIRAGHSTAGPAGRFDGAGETDAPVPDDFLIEVLRATGDAGQVEVTLRVQGREDLGAVVLERVFLVGAGSRTPAGSPAIADPADPRVMTYVFTGVADRGPWRITGESLRARVGAREVTVKHAFDLEVPATGAAR